jgi:hypothetical protein
MILIILFLMECICPSQNWIPDVHLCFLIPFSEIVSLVSYQKGLFQYFVKSKWQVWDYSEVFVKQKNSSC